MTIRKHFMIPFLLLCFAFSSSHVSATEKIETVTLQLRWSHQFQFAGYYAAREKGFYAEEGLNVIFKERDPKKGHIQSVIDGDAVYGVADAGLLLDRMTGKPVVLLKQIFQHSPLVFISRKDSGIISPYEMIGKKVMFNTEGNSDAPLLIMLQDTLGGLEKITAIPHSYNDEDFVSGKVDVMSAYITSEPFSFNQRGIPVNIINPQNFGIDFYGDNLFTTEAEIENHPERVEKMIRATLKGWQYALAHPNEIIDFIIEKYEPTLTPKQLAFEAKMTDLMILSELTPLGSVTPHRYEQIAEIFLKAGLIETAVSLRGFIYKGPDRIVKQPRTPAPTIFLKPEEKAWLAEHDKIVVGGETDWPPFDFVDGSGQYKGIANDYLKLISKELGIEVQMVTGPSWDELLSMIRRKEIDVLPAIYHSKKREAYLHYTMPYTRVTEFIFAREDAKDISNMNNLVGMRVAVVKGYTIEGLLRSRYPNIKLVTAPTIKEALKKLITRDADAFIGDIASTSFNIKRFSLTGIRPVAAAPFSEPTVHMAVRYDWPELKDLIQKVLRAIPQSEHEAIKARWASLPAKQKQEEADRPKLDLTSAETAWLQKHKKVRVMVGTWPPFHYMEKDKPKGLALDYATEILGKLGLEIEYVPILWADALESISKREKIDLLPTIARSKEREKLVHITNDYLSFPYVIFTQKDYPFIGSLMDLHGKTVAVENNFIAHKRLQRDHPDIRLFVVKTSEEALNAVSFGDADAYVSNLAVGSYLIEKLGLQNLKVAAPSGYKADNQAMGVRKDWPELARIINKAFNTFTKAVIKAESNYDPASTSNKGAMGLMQLMPDTAREIGVENPYDPLDNIMGGTRYLKGLLDRYNGDILSALAAYNWGMGNLERHPSRMPRETRTYVTRVGEYYSGAKANREVV